MHKYSRPSDKRCCNPRWRCSAGSTAVMFVDSCPHPDTTATCKQTVRTAAYDAKVSLSSASAPRSSGSSKADRVVRGALTPQEFETLYCQSLAPAPCHSGRKSVVHVSTETLNSSAHCTVHMPGTRYSNRTSALWLLVRLAKVMIHNCTG